MVRVLQRVRDARHTNIAAVAALDDAVAAFDPTGPVEGTAIISVRR